MKSIYILGNQRNKPSYFLFGFAVLIVLALAVSAVVVVNAGDPLDIAGYLDFSYGSTVRAEPTAEKPESKLWWNDGFWWGILYNDAALEYHIYYLDWGEQIWVDTGTAVDDRKDSKSDALWDDNAKKLYVASHFWKSNPSHTSLANERARVYRYSYDPITRAYTQDSGFPKIVNEDKTETLVLDKDSTGRLWVTFVGHDPDPSIDLFRYTVQVNSATDDGANWGTQMRVPVPGFENYVDVDDISSLIAFNDDEGPKIGVMWSNQLDDNFYFATHDDNATPDNGWTLETIDVSPYQVLSDDHINLAKSSSGQVFAAVKTGNTTSGDPQVGIIARDTDGSYSFHVFSDVDSNDTRPIMAVNDDENKVYLFVTSNPIGGRICYKTAVITTPLSDMEFSSGNCLDSGVDGAEFAIADSGYDNMNNVTSTKQSVNGSTGMVVMASDDVNGHVYAHEAIGDPPPVITTRSPERDAINVSVDSVVQATFSKEMKASTFTPANFKVEEGLTEVPGARAYDDPTRTTSFTPSALLKANTSYTVTVTGGVQDKSGNGLYKAESWSFETAPPTAQFALSDYSVNEIAGTATITVTLDAASSQTASVDYSTSDGTATSASDEDYTASGGTLTFDPGETSMTFDVLITDDGTAESNETVILTLSAASGAELGEQITATLIIVDDDGLPSVQFQPASYTVNENAGNVVVNVVLSHPSAETITVDFATSNGTATAGDDYTAVNGTLTFNPSEVLKSLPPISIVNDDLDEANETINLTLSNVSSNATLGDPGSTAKVTINDDDPMSEVRFSTSTYSVNEDAGTATITVNLSKASGLDISVDYATTSGTAAPNVDYTPVSGTLTFLAGHTSKTFDVPILNEGLDEPNEVVNLALNNPTNASLGTPKTAMLTILDASPSPSVQFSSANYVVNENGGSATITVELSEASGQSVAVDYATSGGTATAGGDYTSVAGTLIFLPGDTSKTFTVPINDDSVVEGNETVTLVLSNPDDAILATPSIATLTIIDDETQAPTLRFLPLIFHNN